MRNEGWEKHLVDYIKSSEQASFAWGVNDCALWVGAFVDLITGSEFRKDWENLYDTEEGANALMQERGYSQSSDIMDFYLSKVPLRMAMRGDVVMNQAGCLGVCDGVYSYFLLPERGLTRFKTTQCRKAWRV